MSDKINFEVLIQVVIEFMVSILGIIGVQSGKINIFVSPRFNLPILLSSVVLLLMAAISLRNIFKVRHVYLMKRYMILMTPLMVLMVLPVREMADVKVDFSDIKFTKVSQEYKIEKNKEGPVEIDDMDYLRWYFEVSSHPTEYKDDSFKFVGRVFKSDGMTVVGRMGMLCCMADLQVCGFIYDGQTKLEEGKWYVFEGKVKEADQEKFGIVYMPEIYDIKIKETKEPSEAYVYLV